MKAAISLLLSILSLFTHVLRADDKPAAGAAPAKTYRNVGVDEFDKLRAEKANVVLDVRTAKEFAAGHIENAINIDWNGSDFEKQVVALDKSKTYLVHCAGGVRSVKASDKLMGLKFKSVVNLEGGLKAWEKAGKPVIK